MNILERLKTITHDFKVDPLYNITKFVGLGLLGVLVYGFTLSLIQTFFN
jgi:hypothetical protein